MENIKAIANPHFTKEELLQRQYDQRRREFLIARTRAGVVRSQILRAYEILENIRFDFVSDTAFRDKIVHAKRGLESAINDFLLFDSYWENSIQKHRKMTPEEYDKYLKMPIIQKGQSIKI
jgi:hypothetical protein